MPFGSSKMWRNVVMLGSAFTGLFLLLGQFAGISFATSIWGAVSVGTVLGALSILTAYKVWKNQI